MQYEPMTTDSEYHRGGNFSFESCAVFVALLIASLTSHQAYVEMLGILLLFGTCMLIPDAREVFFSKTSLIWTFSAGAVVTASYLWFLLSPQTHIAAALIKSANNNYMFLMLVVLFLTSLSALITARIETVTSVLAALLTLNGAVLLMQTASLLATKQYIDFVKPVTGEPSRYLNYATVNPVFAYRPTGLYVEPSTYSAAVAAMAVGYILLCRAQGFKPARIPVILAIVSMLITQSAAAVVQALILLVAVVLLQNRSAKMWWAVLLGILVMASPGVIAAYFDSFMLKMDADSGIRLALVKFVFESRRGWDFLFGFGPFGLENDLYRLADDGAINPQVSSLNDAGLLNYFIVKFGMAGFLIPIVLFCRIRKDVAGILFMAMLMSVKLSFTNPILYFGLLPLVMRLPERNAEDDWLDLPATREAAPVTAALSTRAG
jgi:hypothetical protein